MLRNVNNISLDLPREEIDKKIDEYARTPAIAGLLKMDLISEDGKNYWKPNLSTLVKEYDHIGKYELRETEWKKPVEVIYGSLSNHVNTKEI